MADAAARVAAVLGDRADTRWFRAPGRLNLVGEHTDYNDGFVLPLAIDRYCVIAASVSEDMRVRSLDADGVVELAAGGARLDPSTVSPPWGRYVAGVVSELAVRGRPEVGMEAALASDVPLGSGLSSSAALEVACALALVDAAGWELPPRELAQACRAAEEAATGVPCGIMDQLTSIAGVDGAALLIDCRTLEVEPVPLPDDLAVLAVHSGLPRALTGSEYAARRRACQELAARLGVPALRDATLEQVVGDPLGRHVVTENERVLQAVDLLRSGDLEGLGKVLTASHASLRDDFGVSTPELDVLVEQLVAAGAFGARLTGAGFGGCAVAVCASSRVGEIAEAATGRYRTLTGLEPTPFVCRAVAGAGPLRPPAG